MKPELKQIWKKVIISCVKVLSDLLSEEVKKIMEVLCQQVFGKIFESAISSIVTTSPGFGDKLSNSFVNFLNSNKGW